VHLRQASLALALHSQCPPLHDTSLRDTVRKALSDFINRTGADELMLTSQIYDHQARLHSYEIAAEVRESIRPRAAI